MIIERRKRNIVTSQTDMDFGLRHLCETTFVPETKDEARLVIGFVKEILPSNETEDGDAVRMRDIEVSNINDWAENMQLGAINRHLESLRTHPEFEQLIKDISQLITDIEDGV